MTDSPGRVAVGAGGMPVGDSVEMGVGVGVGTAGVLVGVGVEVGGSGVSVGVGGTAVSVGVGVRVGGSALGVMTSGAASAGWAGAPCVAPPSRPMAATSTTATIPTRPGPLFTCWLIEAPLLSVS